jgi:hypothetical protein
MHDEYRFENPVVVVNLNDEVDLKHNHFSRSETGHLGWQYLVQRETIAIN